MNLVKSISEAKNYKKICAALGNFDGVHLGHQQLIKAVTEYASQIDGTPAILTFYPHPGTVLNPNNIPKTLVTEERKYKLFAEQGIHLVIQVAFDKKFAAIEAEDFFQQLVSQIDLALLVVGFNYTFGKGGKGNWKLLESLCNQHKIPFKMIPPVQLEGDIISSSRIRTALTNGDIRLVTKLLGKSPLLEGQVVQGNQIGRKLGYPTANIQVDGNILLPQRGVYITLVKLKDNYYFGMLNIGIRPTVTNVLQQVAEVHILDFNQQIYGSDIEVYLLEKLREEQKFANLEELIAQIKADEYNSRKIINLIYDKKSNNISLL